MKRRIPVLLVLLALVAGCGADDGGTGSAGSTDSSALALEHQLERVVATVSPSVVQVRSSVGLGSGVVYDDRGDIVTNAHVVGSEHSFKVTLSKGDVHDATLVGAFRQGDLAVIRLADAARPRAAAFADSSKLRVGQFAIAIGNPLGLRSSVTQGIVSFLGRTVSEGSGVALSSTIQTSAPINPGNSGGALVDLDAAVIGVPTLAALEPEMGGGQAPGIGFAIPSNTVRDIAGQLIKDGRVERSARAWLGIDATTLTSGDVLVADVPQGPARDAGVRKGDVIVALGGTPTPSTDALLTAIAAHRPRQDVELHLVRSGERTTVTVALGELPAS